jgi:uncharacterized protein with HEPN domain
MPHKLQAIFHDLLTAIAEVDAFISGRTLDELFNDRAFQLILEREFEIIGVALYRIRNMDADMFRKIPSGSQIIAMRNILGHGYDRVDYEIIWDAATHELEPLKRLIESIRVEDLRPEDCDIS